jgi:hypothetical protein
MLDANKNAIAIGDEVLIRGHVRGLGPKTNVTVQLAKQLTPGTFTVLDVDTQHIAKVVPMTAAQLALANTGQLEKVPVGTLAKDTSAMVFTVTVPEAKHGDLAGALDKIGHVKLNSDRRSGSSENTDGTGLTFKLLPAVTGKANDQVEVTVTKNPQNMPQEYFVNKVNARIAELLGAPKPQV